MRAVIEVVAAALLSLQPPPAQAPARILPPVDECGRDESFARFRAHLLDVIARRDAGQLRELVAEDVFYSFGGNEGRDAFFTDFGLQDPQSSALWGALAETLMLGCARRGGEMIAPYAFANWPEFDGVGTSFLALPGTELHREPTFDSEVVATLAWHVVEDVSGSFDEERQVWRQVRLGDGRTGFVLNRHLRVDIDFRAIFEQRAGRWLLTTFVAGD
jgi:hypothetical protein